MSTSCLLGDSVGVKMDPSDGLGVLTVFGALRYKLHGVAAPTQLVSMTAVLSSALS